MIVEPLAVAAARRISPCTAYSYRFHQHVRAPRLSSVSMRQRLARRREQRPRKPTRPAMQQTARSRQRRRSWLIGLLAAPPGGISHPRECGREGEDEAPEGGIEYASWGCACSGALWSQGFQLERLSSAAPASLCRRQFGVDSRERYNARRACASVNLLSALLFGGRRSLRRGRIVEQLPCRAAP